MIVVAGNPPSGPQTMWGVTGGQAFVAGGDWVRYTTQNRLVQSRSRSVAAF